MRLRRKRSCISNLPNINRRLERRPKCLMRFQTSKNKLRCKSVNFWPKNDGIRQATIMHMLMRYSTTTTLFLMDLTWKIFATATIQRQSTLFNAQFVQDLFTNRVCKNKQSTWRIWFALSASSWSLTKFPFKLFFIQLNSKWEQIDLN